MGKMIFGEWYILWANESMVNRMSNLIIFLLIRIWVSNYELLHKDNTVVKTTDSSITILKYTEANTEVFAP